MAQRSLCTCLALRVLAASKAFLRGWAQVSMGILQRRAWTDNKSLLRQLPGITPLVWVKPPVRLGLSGGNSGNFPERPRKCSQSFSWNSSREHGWAPNFVIQGISSRSFPEFSPPQFGRRRLFFQTDSSKEDRVALLRDMEGQQAAAAASCSSSKLACGVSGISFFLIQHC